MGSGCKKWVLWVLSLASWICRPLPVQNTSYLQVSLHMHVQNYLLTQATMLTNDCQWKIIDQIWMWDFHTIYNIGLLIKSQKGESEKHDGGCKQKKSNTTKLGKIKLLWCTQREYTVSINWNTISNCFSSCPHHVCLIIFWTYLWKSPRYKHTFTMVDNKLTTTGTWRSDDSSSCSSIEVLGCTCWKHQDNK